MAGYIYLYNNSGQQIKYWGSSNSTSTTRQKPNTTLSPGSSVSFYTNTTDHYALLSYAPATFPKILTYTYASGSSSTTTMSRYCKTDDDFVSEYNGYSWDNRTFRVTTINDVTACYLNITCTGAEITEVIEGSTSSTASPYTVYFSNNGNIKIRLKTSDATTTISPTSYWTTGSSGPSFGKEVIREGDEVIITLSLNSSWMGSTQGSLTIPVGHGNTVKFIGDRPASCNKITIGGTNILGASSGSAEVSITKLIDGSGYTLFIPYYGLLFPYSSTIVSEMSINGGSWQTVPTTTYAVGGTTINNVKTIKIRISNCAGYAYDWLVYLAGDAISIQSYGKNIAYYPNTTICEKTGDNIVESGTIYLSSNCTLSTNGTWPCFIAGTLITLADRSKKKVEEITYNDELLVWDFYKGEFSKAKPAWIKIEQEADVYNSLTFDNKITLGLVGAGGEKGYHRIYNIESDSFTHTGTADTPIGTHTFTEAGKITKLIKQELITEKVKFYNIITDKYYNLFANGILTSCFLSNQYDIRDMKYVLDERNFDEDFVKQYFDRISTLKAKEND